MKDEERTRNIKTLYTMLHHYAVMESNDPRKVNWLSFDKFLSQRLNASASDDLQKEILNLMIDTGCPLTFDDLNKGKEILNLIIEKGLLTYIDTIDLQKILPLIKDMKLLAFRNTIVKGEFYWLVKEFKQTANPYINEELLAVFVRLLTSKNNVEREIKNREELFFILYKYFALDSVLTKKVDLETFKDFIKSRLFEGEGSRERIVKLMEELGLLENQGLEKKKDGSYSKKVIDRFLDSTLHPAQEA
jgi:hypothetical protein